MITTAISVIPTASELTLAFCIRQTKESPLAQITFFPEGVVFAMADARVVTLKWTWPIRVTQARCATIGGEVVTVSLRENSSCQPVRSFIVVGITSVTNLEWLLLRIKGGKKRRKQTATMENLRGRVPRPITHFAFFANTPFTLTLSQLW